MADRNPSKRVTFMYSSILIALDLDEPSSWAKAVPTGLDLARLYNAEIAFVYVVPDLVLNLHAQWSGLSVRRILDDARLRLAKLADELAAGTTVAKHVTSGSVYAGILEAGEQIGTDLIILSSHRPGMKDYLLGANAARVVRHACCSVMVVRD